MSHGYSSRARPAGARVLAGVLLAAAGAAWAGEGDPLSVFLNETLTHDDNIFRRAPAATPIGDTIRNTQLRATFDTTQGRQQFHGEAAANANHFAQQSQLNGTTTAYRGSWLGTLLTVFKVDASASRNQSLSNYADFRGTVQNVVTTDARYLSLDYAGTPDWSLGAKAAHGSSTNGAAANAQADLTTDSVELRGQYTTPKGSQAGLALRKTNGHYPNRQQPVPGVLIDNSYRQDDLEGTLRWAPGGKSALNLRLARTRRDEADLPQRNFKGYTGGLSFDWTPTGVTALNLYARRDLSALDYILANYSVIKVRGISVSWLPTAKLSATAKIDRQSRVFAGDPGFLVGSGLAQPGDSTKSASLALQYTASRNALLSLQLRREARASGDATFNYEAKTVVLGAQLTF